MAKDKSNDKEPDNKVKDEDVKEASRPTKKEVPFKTFNGNTRIDR